MKFADFVSTEAIRASLSADDKPGVIHELTQALAEAGRIKTAEVEGIVKAIMKREELGSTGIGRGVAVPHTKHPSVQRLVGTVAVSSDGIDFNSLDGEKVQLFFLLVSPPDRPGDHLRALENISRHLRNDNFCNFLRQAGSAPAVIELRKKAANNHRGGGSGGWGFLGTRGASRAKGDRGCSRPFARPPSPGFNRSP